MEITGTLILGIIFIAIALLIAIVIVRWIWNSTISELFKIRSITLWEAFKILLLCAILFSGGRLPFHYSITHSEGNQTITKGIGK